MKLGLLFFATCLFAASAAHAADDAPSPLQGVTELGIVLGKSVTLHDECVKKGLIVKMGPSAAEEFDQYLDRIRAGTGIQPPKGMTLRQMAEATQNGFDFAVQHLAEKPLNVNEKTCGDLAAHWSEFAKSTGLAPAR